MVQRIVGVEERCEEGLQGREGVLRRIHMGGPVFVPVRGAPGSPGSFAGRVPAADGLDDVDAHIGATAEAANYPRRKEP